MTFIKTPVLATMWHSTTKYSISFDFINKTKKKMNCQKLRNLFNRFKFRVID